MLLVNVSFGSSYYLSACKVYGLVKYYSGIETAKLDSLTKGLIISLDRVSTDQDFDQSLSSFLLHLPAIKGSNKDLTNLTSQNIDSSWLAFRKKDPKSHVLKTSFQWIFNDEHLSPEIRTILLRVLFSRPQKRAETIKRQQKYLLDHNEELPPNSINTTLHYTLSLFKLWNVVSYFYPYKSIMDESWDSAFESVYPNFVAARNAKEYADALRVVSAKLNDSHVSLQNSKKHNYKDYHRIPLILRFVNNQLYVANVLYSKDIKGSLLPCDRITRINDMDIDSLWEKYKTTQSFSNDAMRDKGFGGHVSFMQYKDSVVHLTIVRDDTLYQCEITSLTMPQWRLNALPNYLNTFAKIPNIIDDSIGYLFTENLTYFKFNRIYRKVKNKPYLIIDGRCYGTLAMFKLLRRLNRYGQDVSQAYYPLASAPGVFKKASTENYFTRNAFEVIIRAANVRGQIPGRILPSLNPVYKGRVYVLMDNHAISFGETALMSFRKYRPDAVFVGSPTAGANGNVSTMKLPYGLSLNFTGIDFMYSDGTPVQRVGVQPDILVPASNDPCDFDDHHLKKAIALIKGEDLQ